MLRKLGLAVAQRPKTVLLSWITALIVIGIISLSGAFSPALFDKLSSAQPAVPSDSTTANKLLEQTGSGSPFIVLLKGSVAESKAGDYAKAVTHLSQELKSDVSGAKTVTPAGLPAELVKSQPALKGLHSSIGDLLLVTHKTSFSTNELAKFQTTVTQARASFKPFGVKLEAGHADLIAPQLSHQAEIDLKQGELVSLPLALLVMILVFGGFLAAAMPLVGAGASIFGGLGALYLFTTFMEIDITVLNVVTVIGLGVSIDYGLLFISRYREVLRAHPATTKESIAQSVAEAVDTAGRTVIFSGLTIAIAISSLLVFQASIMKSVAVSASAVILISVLSTITLIPAVVTLLGARLVNPSPLTKPKFTGAFLRKFGDVAPAEGFFSKLVDKIAKAPKLIATVSLLILLAFGSGILSLNVSNSGTPYLAKNTGQVGFFNELSHRFEAFKVADITVVAKTKAGVDAAYTVLHTAKNAKTVVPPTVSNGLWATSADSASPKRVITELRTAKNHTEYFVTGATAQDIDFNNSMLQSMPLALSIIVLTTFILLFLLTGSVFIPLKAIVLSALSLGASVGVLTWGFEGGGLAGLLSFDPHGITGLSPLILALAAVFGFGLAMDYEVFLISRIKEAKDRGLTASQAVREGVQGSGRIITSAGLIIIVVFLGFTMGDMLMVKQIGVALAVAVLIDMTIVRTIAVPAIMLAMGEAAWWAPKPLKKLYARFGLKH